MRLPESTTATARAIDSMPSVTTKGGRPTKAMNTPLTQPMIAPAARPRPTAIHQLCVQAASFHQSGIHGIGCFNSTRPQTIATTPITEPTERSMPPVMMTGVMPSAMMPMKAKLRVMLKKLSSLANTGSRMLITPLMITSATVTQNAWLPISVSNRLLSRVSRTGAAIATSEPAPPAGRTCLSSDMNGPGNQPRDFLWRRGRGRLIRDLAAAP